MSDLVLKTYRSKKAVLKDWYLELYNLNNRLIVARTFIYDIEPKIVYFGFIAPTKGTLAQACQHWNCCLEERNKKIFVMINKDRTSELTDLFYLVEQGTSLQDIYRILSL